MERDILSRDLVNEGLYQHLHLWGYAHVLHGLHHEAIDTCLTLRLVVALGITGTLFRDLPGLEIVKTTIYAYLQGKYDRAIVQVATIDAAYYPIQGFGDIGCLVEDAFATPRVAEVDV